MAKIARGGAAKGTQIPAFLTGSSVVLGASQSAVTTYTLRPSPAVTWQHSISPGTTVTAVSCYNDQGRGVCFGSKEKKKYFVNVVTEDDAKELQAAVGAEVSALRMSEDGRLLFVALANSHIKCFSVTDTELSEKWALPGKSSRSAVYTKFIDDIEDGPEHGAVLVVSKRDVGKRAAFEVKVAALGEEAGSELVAEDVEIRGEDGEELGEFAYDNNVLYRWVPSTGVLSGRSIFAETGWRFRVPEAAGGDTILALGNDKVLLAGPSAMTLADTKYHAVVATQKTAEPLKLAAYSPGMKTAIALSQSGSTAWGVTVDLGRGTLLEAIGKGHSDESARFDFGYSQVLVKKGYGLREYGSVLRDMMETSRERNEAVLAGLGELKAKGTEEKFSQKLIAYMKGTVEWDEADTDAANGVAGEEAVYDADGDREVDQDLVTGIVSLVLTVEDGATKMDGFVPEIAMVYLLTHPLFPTTELPGLLSALASRPRLLRQAIVTAPALQCEALVDVLSTEDDEIFGDAVTRLAEEYPSETTLQALRASNTVDIPAITDRIVRLDVGWGLMSVLVDAGGLFAWKGEVLGGLQEAVDGQIAALESSSETMLLIEEALRKLATSAAPAPDVARVSKRQLKKLSRKAGTTPAVDGTTKAKAGPELLSAEQREQQRLRGVLGFGLGTDADAAKSKQDRLKHAHDVDRRVPAYSVEKLIL